MRRYETVVVILAGGSARRLARKLERTIDGVPILERVYRRLRDAYPIVVCARDPLPAGLSGAIDAPVLLDCEPGGGPLAALVAACAEIDAQRIAAIAGDMPRIDAGTIACMERAWDADCDAVVPEHDGRIEPLAALYDRGTLAQAGAETLRAGRRSMHALLERLRVRTLAMAGDPFLNINTPGDLERAIAGATEPL